MKHTKEELYQALTILQEECLSQPNCAQCPLGREGECVMQNEAPQEYRIHDPNTQIYRAFD